MPLMLYTEGDFPPIFDDGAQTATSVAVSFC